MQRAFHSIFFATLPLATISCLLPFSTQAQVTPDGTTATTVNGDGTNFAIEQGDRIGDNLFHSFDEFSVPTMGSATFNNLDSIANIFSRVTGSSISNIDGVLGANGAANLFLINPNGIVFGQNARLDLGGSFFASTADSLLFEGDTEFSAVDPQAPPLLQVSIPIGLSFRDNPGDIVNRSRVQNSEGDFVGLEIASGQTLAFIGGNINFEGGVATARGGNIYLGGLSQAGIINLNPDGSFSFFEDVSKANINLNNFADINVTGTEGGNITINANNLNIEAGEVGRSFIRAGITSDSTSADAQAGNITLNIAENITLDNSSIWNRVNSGGVGNAGNINISSTNLNVTNGGQIDASTDGQGNAGLISITTTGNLTFDGENSGAFASGATSTVLSGAVGDAGGITISTANLNLTNGGQVNASTRGQGNAGLISITATGDLTFDGEDSEAFPSGVASTVLSRAVGDAGGITISTANLNLTNGGRVTASTRGQGNAGLVSITATGNLTFDGEDSDGIPSGVTSAVVEDGIGDSGGITIATTNLNLTKGGRVNASAFGQGNAGSISITAAGDLTFDGETSDAFGSGVFSNVGSNTEGDSGGIIISTANLTLTKGGRVNVSTFGQGNAGLISIIATEDLTIDGENSNAFSSGIVSQVNQSGIGDSGGITISTTNLNLTNGGAVSAGTAGQGNAGLISIAATEDLIVDGENSDGIPSGVASEVVQGAIGDSGGITISTTDLNLTNGGQINASTFGQGNAGAVNITANKSISIDGSIERFRSGISANALNEDGNGGNISINTERLTIANGGTIEATNFEDTGLEASPGTGRPGNISITANSIDLASNARIEAATQFVGEEGSANINLDIAEDLILENNSLISAKARANATGGNVTINANDGLIIAFPDQDNNIIASADDGKGGAIDITTEAIFGLEVRPNNSTTNDIDASSGVDGLDGTVDINNPAVDPTTGLINLPASVGDASDQISQNPCQQGVGSQFIVTGKGGLPPTVNESLNSESARVELIEPVEERLGDKETGGGENNTTTAPEAVPAMGWVFNDKGEVTLTAYKTTDAEINRSSQATSNSCSAPKNK